MEVKIEETWAARQLWKETTDAEIIPVPSLAWISIPTQRLKKHAYYTMTIQLIKRITPHLKHCFPHEELIVCQNIRK